MLVGLVVVGFIGVFMYALTSTTGFAMTASVGSMVAGGVLVLGGSLGFLFGLPRTLVGVRVPVKDEPTNPDARNERVPDFQQNTNLEEISDWLTKILVGVGLTQLSGISQALNQAAMAIQGALGSPPQNYVFALAILIYFPVCGFLVGYLWTRINLANVLTRSELDRMRQENDVKTQTRALSLAAQAAKDTLETAPSALPNQAPKKAGLWVDDNPSNNASLEQSFETLLNIDIDQSLSTEDALQRLTLKPGKYSFVISDIGRPPDSDAGFHLLRAIKDQGIQKLPFFIYSTRARVPEVQDRAKKEGADGIAGSPQELLQFLRKALTQTV